MLIYVDFHAPLVLVLVETSTTKQHAAKHPHYKRFCWIRMNHCSVYPVHDISVALADYTFGFFYDDSHPDLKVATCSSAAASSTHTTEQFYGSHKR